MKKRFFVSLITILVLFASFLPSPVSADTLTNYTINAQLDFQREFMEVKETVNYTNRTPKELNSIVFNVTPAHFRAFNLKTALVDGTQVQAKMDDVVMELPLPKPLGLRQTTQIQLEFSLDIPEQGGRFGIQDHVLALGNWFPILAVYSDRNGWDRHKYNPFGDPFFTEAANYDVTLDVTSDVKVAHSGDLVSHEGNTWHMKGTNLRDFAITASSRYETRTANVDGVTVTTYYLPEHGPAGKLYMDVAVQALQWLTKRLGPLPYKSLDIAETVSSMSELVGQEYPNLLFISSAMADKADGIKSPLGYTVAHEIVHQWFYSLVGNDQMYDPWMDEAHATYLGYQIVGMPPLTPKSPIIVAAGDTPVSSSIYDFKDEGTYSDTIYGRGALFLQELSATMGSDNFYKMLRSYVELYRDKIATPQDYFSLAQSSSKTNLNALIRKYFVYPQFKGDSVPKLDVKWAAGDTWTGSTSIGFESDAKVQQATVDADGRVLLTQDNPSSPLTVDISQLEDDDYVVHLIIKDGDGRYAEQAHRVRITNPRPTPVPTIVPSNQTKNASGNVAGEVSNIAKSFGSVNVKSIIMYGGAGLGGLVVLVFLGVAVKFITSPSVKVEQMPRMKKDRILEVKPMPPLDDTYTSWRPRQTIPSAPPHVASTPTGTTPLPPTATPPTSIPTFKQARSKGDQYGKRGMGELEELETATGNDQIIVDTKRTAQPGIRRNEENKTKGEDVPFLGDFMPNDKR